MVRTCSFATVFSRGWEVGGGGGVVVGCGERKGGGISESKVKKYCSALVWRTHILSRGCGYARL